MSDRYSSFQVAEGTALQSDLGFLAATVIVDNVTASWVFMPNAGRFVPPFTYGATFPLGAGVQVAQAAWRTPPGVTAPTPSGGQAQVVFTDAALAPSNGQPVVIPSQQVPLPVTAVISLTNPGGSGSAATVGATTINLGTTPASTVVVRYAVPAGANSLIIVGNATGAQPSEFNFTISVRGTTTNTYYTVGPAGTTGAYAGQPPLAVVIASAADTTIEVTYTNNPSNVVATFEVCAVFGTQAIAVQNSAATVLTVQGGAGAGNGNAPGGVLDVAGFGGTSGFKQANNAAVVFTNAPDASHYVHILFITVMFSGGAPSGAPSLTLVGSLQGTIWQVNVNSQTPLHFPFMDGGVRGIIGETLTLTLGASGVAGVFGLLNIGVDTRTF